MSGMKMENRAYGAMIERGTITAILGGKYIVASLDRSGIVSPMLDTLGSAGSEASVSGVTLFLTAGDDTQYAVGDTVYFFMFRDGTGTILGRFSSGSGEPVPSAPGLISENTTDGWAAMPLYVPKDGEFCIYSDIHELKIGDGQVPIVDLPFVGHHETQAVNDALMQHINNTAVHVTQDDRDFWDAKLNCGTAGETLIFTRS